MGENNGKQDQFLCVDLENIDEPVRVKYPKAESVYVGIRPLSSGKRQEFEDQCTSYEMKYFQGQLLKVPDPDETAVENLIRDWVFAWWEGVRDRNGNEIPCEGIAKSKVLGIFHDFRRWGISLSLDYSEVQRQAVEKIEQD
jgi:hypothetical protein